MKQLYRCNFTFFNSIFYLLRTGGQWQSLDSLDPTRYAKRSTSHTRFQEWQRDGFFVHLWEAALGDYDEKRKESL